MWALHAAAAMALLAGVAFSGWLLRRARRTLGKPHPGWRWYLAAIACLIGGLLLVPLMIVWPERWPSLRLLHLHLNTLGFVGLTAIGTLQVLMPTVLSGPDVEASVRLRRDLLPAVIGVALVALGAAFWRPLALFGSGLLLYVVARLGMAWLRRYGWRTIADSGAASGLAAALCGFLLLLLFGGRTWSWLDERTACRSSLYLRLSLAAGFRSTGATLARLVFSRTTDGATRATTQDLGKGRGDSCTPVCQQWASCLPLGKRPVSGWRPRGCCHSLLSCYTAWRWHSRHRRPEKLP